MAKGCIPLTNCGKKFIDKICGSGDENNSLGNSNSNSLLTGKNSWVLPYTNPKTERDKIWTANVYHNGNKVTNNREFGNALKEWYTIYPQMYGLDANFLLIQAYHESGFKTWTYSTTGALGITQFVPLTIEDVIVKNWSSVEPKFTIDEQEKITGNIDGPYSGQSNRAILHQNIIDNPEIMIKAQCRYMKYIANKANNYASIALFGYNRGHALIKKTYIDSIERAREYGLSKEKKEEEYEKEGVNYVNKIFTTLYNNFEDYKDLKMESNNMISDGNSIKMLNSKMENS